MMCTWRSVSLIAVFLAGLQLVESLSCYRINKGRPIFGTLHRRLFFITPTNGTVDRVGAVPASTGLRHSLTRYAETDENSNPAPGVTGDAEGKENITLSRVHDDKEDHMTIHEKLESKSIDYIDKELYRENEEKAKSDETKEEGDKDSSYFNWDKVRDNRNDTSDEVVKSVDSTGKRELEKGQRPYVSGHGTDMEISVENYPTNVDTGRINEWNASWVPGEKVMSFFPILIDEYSLLPSPLQLGFEESVTFRGKYVDMTFNSLLDTVQTADGGTKQIYGMCFINPSSGQIAPVAVYAELLSREAFIDGGGERLKVRGRVYGRVILQKVIMEEPFIKAKVIPMEDNPHFTQAEEVPKLVDEITNLYESCNTMECEIMELLDQPYAISRIKARKHLHDIIDDKLDNFKVDLERGPQAFAQIAAYTAFDYHLTPNERYDALVMQDSFDRLRYVRDCLKTKVKQLNVLKKAPREKLDDIVDQMKKMQMNKEEAFGQDAEQAQENNG